MRPVILNKEELLEHSCKELRGVVLDVLEQTLLEMDSYRSFLKNITVEESILRIGDRSWDLDKARSVYLICGGKAANATAMALETLLGPRLTGGVVIVKSLEGGDRFSKCEVYVGGHPLSNLEGYQGCCRIFEMLEKIGPEDLVISAISGGTSALMACPKPGLSLEADILTSDILLKSGANIHEINSVRRHISRTNGGNLAKQIEAKGAEMILLMHVDAIGSAPTQEPWVARPVFGGPMAPDPTTLQDAKNTIRNYGLQDKLPRTVVEFLENSTEADETPKELKRHTTFAVNTLPDLSACAQQKARKMGINAHILSSSMVGDSQQAGAFFASLAREIQTFGRPYAAPCLLIASGEVYTMIDDPRSVRGSGGPGQEMVVAFALANRDMPGVCFASIDSEGTDGPTPAAGGIVDSCTYAYALEKGVDLHKALRRHSTHQALGSLGCLVYSGNTGTTLCDLHLLYIV
ncbi:MAG: DUF4147 domain-containing protein [Candidatus Pelethousia sp.]|nr:DUF4147 domain-containing protein [Candidatus Pelethousia sp.]